MEKEWKDKWEERYSKPEFAYGTAPNVYFKSKIDKLPPGKILLPADGEGRNSVYAAMLGWDASVFDISREGQRKALELADEQGVQIDYIVGGLEAVHYEEGAFDVIALIYAHFPANIKSHYHKSLDKYLKKGGTIIFEAFSKKHLEYQARNERVGGPRDIESLFSIEEIRSDFANYDFEELTETEVELNEGSFHKGTGCVIRFVARKR